tara:strand:- start:981 stop:1139 length:159 start_codon:yes stop_codon:yes gene_type:complete
MPIYDNEKRFREELAQKKRVASLKTPSKVKPKPLKKTPKLEKKTVKKNEEEE